MSNGKDDIGPKIRKITLGLRHRRTFAISDFSGIIIDQILNDEGSPFSSEYFNTTHAVIDSFGEKKGRILFDEERNNSILIDVDNVIFTLATDDIEKTTEEIKNKYIPYITKNIHKEFEIKNFNRLGIVYEYDINRELNSFVSRLTNNTLSNAQSGIFKIAAKGVDKNSMVMRDLLDFKNNLIAVTFGEETSQAKFDYQFYFKPEIKSTGDIDFNAFIDESREELKNKFLKWLTDEKGE